MWFDLNYGGVNISLNEFFNLDYTKACYFYNRLYMQKEFESVEMNKKK